MLASERRVLITNIVIKNKIVHVHTLANEFNVSKMTIRRDLNKLEKEGLVIRTHGGAYFNDELSEQLDYQLKKEENKDIKNEIGLYAASLVKDNDTIAINTSTVTASVARFLIDKKITVITNSLDVINTLADSETISLIVVGGNYIPKYRSFEGYKTIRDFSDHSYDLCFVGTNGIVGNNIYTGAKLESQAKKIIIQNSKQPYILTENSKWFKEGSHLIANINQVKIITKNSPIKHRNIIDIAR